MAGKNRYNVELTDGSFVEVTLPPGASTRHVQAEINRAVQERDADFVKSVSSAVAAEGRKAKAPVVVPQSKPGKSVLSFAQPDIASRFAQKPLTAPTLGDTRRELQPDTISAPPRNNYYLPPERALKAGVGDLVEGVGDLLALPSNAVSALTGIDTFNANWGEDARNYLGLGERGNPYAEALNINAVQGLAGAGAAKAALPFLGATGQAVATGLGADEPLYEGIASAGGGVAAKAAEEAGLPGWAQFGAGMLGGVGTYGGAKIATDPLTGDVIRAVAGDTKGTFLGESALNVDKVKLETAKRMVADNPDVSNEELRKATGMWRSGKDRKLRWEISDRDMTIDQGRLAQLKKGEQVDYREIFSHPLLEDNYTNLSDGQGRPLTVRLVANTSKSKGGYDRGTHSVLLNPTMSMEDMRGTLAHELQHFVQRREGFARGGGVEKGKEVKFGPRYDEAKRFVADLKKKYTDHPYYATGQYFPPEAREKWFRENNRKLKRIAGEEYYYRIPGESEANNVAGRLDFTDEMLAEIDPDLTQPYSWAEQDPFGDSFPDRQGIDASTEPTEFGGPLTPEMATSNFDNWFSGSKVVDEQGKPLTVYHGSPERGLGQFDTSRITTRSAAGDTPGTYFTTDPHAAYGYARPPISQRIPGQKTPFGQVYPANLSLQNPLDTTDAIAQFQKQGMTFMEAKREALKGLQPGVHDGIIFRGNDVNSPEYVAFEPTQIKSTSNRGTYDPNDPRIDYSKEPTDIGGPITPEQTTSKIKLRGFKVPEAEPFELGDENPLNWRERVIDGGGVEIKPSFSGGWHLQGLRAIEPGGGRRAMQAVIDEADRLGVEIDLTPEPLDTYVGKKMGRDELIDWYRQFGFEGGENGMVRPAGGKTDMAIEPTDIGEPIPEGLQAGRSDAVSRAFEGVTDYDGALKVAEAGGHLKADKSGKLIGSPDLTKRQLGAWRGRLDKLIADAKQMGLGWYEDVRKVIGEVSETPEQASLMARGGAAYSPQASPTQETNYFLRHHNERVLSGEEPVITTAQRASAVNKGYGETGANSGFTKLTPEDINLGKKTGPYGVSKDPTVPMGWEAASDLWHGRALEYPPNEGQEAFDRAFSDTEHAFIKGENVLALERAKAAGALPPDATVANLQEVVWVKKRYDTFMDKENARFAEGKRKKQGPPTHEEALRYALEGVRRGIDRGTAVVSREFTPGGGLGEFPGMSANKELNERYATEMAAPGGDKSTEISALQMYQKPTVRGEGYWVDPEEGLQQNPAFMDRPLVGLSPEMVNGKPGGVAMAPRERNALLAVGRLFGIENLQHGVGANIFVPANSSHKASQLNGMYFGPTKREAAMDRALAAGLDVVDNGDGGIVVTSFAGDGAKAVKGFAPDLGGKLGRFDSNYVESGLSAWDDATGETVARPQGEGIATKELLEATGSIPGFEQRLASSNYPAEVAERNAIRQKYAHELATSLRPDVQRLRDLLAKGGPAAVREWVRVHGWKGLPAWGAVLLGGGAMLSSEDQPQPSA